MSKKNSVAKKSTETNKPSQPVPPTPVDQENTGTPIVEEETKVVDPTLPEGAVIMTAPDTDPEAEEKTFEEQRQLRIQESVNTLVDTLGIEFLEDFTDIAAAQSANEALKLISKLRTKIKAWAETEEEFEDDGDDSALRLIGKGQIPDSLESGGTLFAGFDKNIRIGSFIEKKGHKFQINAKGKDADDERGRRIHEYLITHIPADGEEGFPLKASLFRGTFSELDK